MSLAPRKSSSAGASAGLDYLRSEYFCFYSNVELVRWKDSPLDATGHAEGGVESGSDKDPLV